MFGEGEGFYDGYGEINFGVMVHGFDYPDETGKDEMSVRLWLSAKMENGYIRFPMPNDDSEITRRFIKPMKAKRFENKVNFLGLHELEFDTFFCEKR